MSLHHFHIYVFDFIITQCSHCALSLCKIFQFFLSTNKMMNIIQCGMNVCCQGGDGSDSDSMWYMSSSDSEGSDDNVNKYTGPMTADHFLKKYDLSCVHFPRPLSSIQFCQTQEALLLSYTVYTNFGKWAKKRKSWKLKIF